MPLCKLCLTSVIPCEGECYECHRSLLVHRGYSRTIAPLSRLSAVDPDREARIMSLTSVATRRLPLYPVRIVELSAGDALALGGATLTVVGIDGDTVRLGVSAPQDVPVGRVEGDECQGQ